MLEIRNLDLESEAAQTRSELNTATARATYASLHYTEFGAAEQERQHLSENDRLLSDKLSQLSVVSPISGVIVSPHTEDLSGRSLDEGDLALQVADVSEMKAEVYIPEFSLHDAHPGEQVRLLPQGQVTPVSGVLSQISPAAAPIADGLIQKNQLQGINAPRFYLGTVLLANNGSLMPGMTGSAKILAGKRSLAGLAFRFGGEFIQRKIW